MMDIKGLAERLWKPAEYMRDDERLSLAAGDLRALLAHVEAQDREVERVAAEECARIAGEGALVAEPVIPPMVQDLALLIRRMAKHCPSVLADKALDYLKRKGLQGSVLRSESAAPESERGP